MTVTIQNCDLWPSNLTLGSRPIYLSGARSFRAFIDNSPILISHRALVGIWRNTCTAKTAFYTGRTNITVAKSVAPQNDALCKANQSVHRPPRICCVVLSWHDPFKFRFRVCVDLWTICWIIDLVWVNGTLCPYIDFVFSRKTKNTFRTPQSSRGSEIALILFPISHSHNLNSQYQVLWDMRNWGSNGLRSQISQIHGNRHNDGPLKPCPQSPVPNNIPRHRVGDQRHRKVLGWFCSWNVRGEIQSWPPGFRLLRTWMERLEAVFQLTQLSTGKPPFSSGDNICWGEHDSGKYLDYICTFFGKLWKSFGVIVTGGEPMYLPI